MARRDSTGPPVAGAAVGRGEESVYRDRARRLGLPFAETAILGESNSAVTAAAVRRGTFAMASDGSGIALIAPDETALPSIKRWVVAHPEAAKRLSVATPTAVRTALMASGSREFAARAIARLSALYPGFSAKRTVTPSQIAFGLVAIVSLVLALHGFPAATLVTLNLTASLLFFGVTVLRFIAASLLANRRSSRPIAFPSENLPIYTVLVPLFREEGLARDLVAALGRLAWPRNRLDIKLIVEEDDLPTRQAVERATPGPPYEVVVVPRSGPRTKPKALAYALTFARGHLVTVYDAEDRPHPNQLREAYLTFAQSEPDLACLQAPIIIDDPGTSLIARLFAVEYSTLFDGLMPALSALRLPLPLGGTSNHFRREALENVGGWDPFNVTEDADLGIRLARFGYRTGMLTLPTAEEAPANLMPWLRQRTRWFKGWLQTWLVHMRRPLDLLAELGPRQFIGFNLIGLGMLVSALIHPVYIGTLAVAATNPLILWGDGGLLAATVVGVNLFNLVAGYLAMVVLAGRTLALRGRERDASIIVALPYYWLLMSIACVRAIAQLMRRPHHWDKTPHRGLGPVALAPAPSLSPREAQPAPRIAGRIGSSGSAERGKAPPDLMGEVHQARAALDRAFDRLRGP